MKELDMELSEMQDELDGAIRREMRVVIQSKVLSAKEKAMLKKNGVEDIDRALQLDGMTVSPNPSNGFFRLNFVALEAGDIRVLVHDGQGERVHEETIKQFQGYYERTLDLSDKASGTYFLIIQQNGRSAARKLIRH